MALRAEAEALRTKTREQAALIDRLQRRLGEGYVVPPPSCRPPRSSAAGAGADSQMDRLRESLSEAERTLQLARAGAPAPDAGRVGARTASSGRLKARAEDQAGEIARLKAALAAFEQTHDRRRGPEEQPARAQGARRLRRGAGRAPGRNHRQAQGRAGGRQRASRPASRPFHGGDAPHRLRHAAALGAGAAPGTGRPATPAGRAGRPDPGPHAGRGKAARAGGRRRRSEAAPRKAPATGALARRRPARRRQGRRRARRLAGSRRDAPNGGDT